MVSKKYILFLVSAFNILTVDIFAHEQISNEKVVLQLDWKHQFEYAGYYIAKEKGFYNQVGLNVEIKEFNGDSIFTTISEVEKNPERVSNFVSASINGWKYALENIDETINMILEKYNSQNKCKKFI